MNHILPIAWKPVVCGFLCLSTLCSCTPAQKSTKSSISESLRPIEQVNFTPFDTSLWLSQYDSSGSSTEEPGYFRTAMMKVVLVPWPDGSTRLAQKQDKLESHITVSSGCNPGVIAVSEQVSFRKQAEVYIKADRAKITDKTTVAVGGAVRKVGNKQGCVRFATPSEPWLMPFPKEGTSVSVRGLADGEKLDFELPPEFTPWILVRYVKGAMMPVPMRPDLLVVDVERKELVVTYRATFPVTPVVRKLEFRLITDRVDPWAGETPARAQLRHRRSLSYLRSCPVPKEPPEQCSLPDKIPDPIFFNLAK